MKRDVENSRLLIGLIGGAALIVMTMLTAIFLVSRRPVVVVVPGGNAAPAIAGNASMPAAAAPAASAANPAPPMPEIAISKVASAPTPNNPLDTAWDRISVVEVDLAPQQVAQPTLEKGTVTKLRVQATRDDRRYVWRLSWDKVQPVDKSDVALFTDAVAMQFPMVDGAPYTMGGPNLPVRMLFWKATWQKDVDQGFQGLDGIHPNTHADLYWFAKGKGHEDHHSAGSIDNPVAKQWMIAAQSHNPMVDFQRKNPIEELSAHGFGTSTHMPQTPSQGQGVWKEGKWYVVIDRPIDTADPLIARFNASPEKQLIAFALWDGDSANRGGKKQITNWLPMRIAQ